MPHNLRTPEQILRHAARLSVTEKNKLAYALMDMAGIVLFAGVDIHSLREDLEEDDDCEIDIDSITDEELMEAASGASEGHWSDVSAKAEQATMTLLMADLGLTGTKEDGK